MIRAQQLTKFYESRRAVDRVGFEIERGEVVGLLGPNGAGKTTTMRMLTTYLQPTSGRAWLGGHDVLDEPLEVRRKIGYLPEMVPLYNEMRVREFLRFRSQLRDIPRSHRQAAIGRAMERCQIADMADRSISTLSRGYRQRVGLAESILHDPEILILDEPTGGLDPIQTREARALIRELGESRVVLLSTHVLSEVEAVCARAIVMARGKIALDERLDQSSASASQSLRLDVRGPAQDALRAIQTVAGAERATIAQQSGDIVEFDVPIDAETEIREELAGKIAKNGWGLRHLELKRSSLEERFVQAVRDVEAQPSD